MYSCYITKLIITTSNLCYIYTTIKNVISIPCFKLALSRLLIISKCRFVKNKYTSL